MENYNQQKPGFWVWLRDNFVWIIFVVIVAYVFCASYFQYYAEMLLISIPGVSYDMFFILQLYTSVIGSIVFLFIFCLIFRYNWPIWRSFRLGWHNNSLGALGKGLLIGFVMNFACILCALAHGDIKLYYDFSIAQLPVLLFGLFSVFIQSTSEELWCRGIMYERLNKRYPLWFCVLINGVFFGLLHSFNPGVSVFAIVGIVVCGLSFSLARWYFGTIWVPMGIHTAWNFTQNLLFGLPNSGLVSEFSVFHLDAANGISNWIYDWDFGVEGAVPGLLADLLLGVVCLWLGYRSGRLHELTMRRSEIEAARVEPVMD